MLGAGLQRLPPDPGNELGIRGSRTSCGCCRDQAADELDLCDGGAVGLRVVAAQVIIGSADRRGLAKDHPRVGASAGYCSWCPIRGPACGRGADLAVLFTPTLSPINAFFDLFGITVPAFLTTQYGAIFAIVVADTWTNFPFAMLMIMAALQGISPDLDEAAAIDGATRMQDVHLHHPAASGARPADGDAVSLHRHAEALPDDLRDDQGRAGPLDAGDELLRLSSRPSRTRTSPTVRPSPCFCSSSRR